MKKLLLLLALAASSPFLTPLSAVEPGFKEYYNPKLNFRFTYPENWTLQDAKKGDAYVRIFAPQEGSSTFRNMIEVTRQTVPAGTALPTWAEGQVEPLQKTYPGLTLIGSGPVTIRGKEAYSSNFALEISGVKGTLTRIYTLQGNLLFTSTLLAEAGKLEQLMPILQNAMNSLKSN